jgi:hypothetical protein
MTSQENERRKDRDNILFWIPVYTRSVRTPVRFPPTLHYRNNAFQCRLEVSGIRFDFRLFCIIHLICYVTNDMFFLELRLICIVVELWPLMGILPVLPVIDKRICSSDKMITDIENQSSGENFSSALWPSKTQNGRASDSNRAFVVKIDLTFSHGRKNCSLLNSIFSHVCIFKTSFMYFSPITPKMMCRSQFTIS